MTRSNARQGGGGELPNASDETCNGKPVRMCVIVTVDITLLNLCRGRFEYLSSRGFEITVICAPTQHAAELERRGVHVFTAPLHRAITPLCDLRAIWRVYRFLRRERFDIVEVSTPKGALIGSIAASLARVPSVVHLLRGLVYEGQSGARRRLLRLSQALPCMLAGEVISVSYSLAEQAVADGLCPRSKIRVLGQGSSNGVDVIRFAPVDSGERLRVRESFGIPASAVVAGFVGRMTKDKGIVELVHAFTDVAARETNLYLLLVGDYETRDRPESDVVEAIAGHVRIRHVGWQEDTARFYKVMDFLVLPTYREGFPTVLLEAAATALPTVSTDVVGCRDAVVAEETALLVPARDAKALATAIDRMATDKPLRERLGAAGRQRVETFFDQRTVWSLQEAALRRLLSQSRVDGLKTGTPTK